jgi:hypothetical protein
MLHKGGSIIPLLEIDGDLVVILFGNSSQNIYMDLGGHAEENETIFDTSIREGREESLNTFNISIDKIYNLNDKKTIINNYVEHSGYYGFFYKYNIKFEDLAQIYNHNKKIIYSLSNVPKYWKETKSINIFKINSLIRGDSHDNKYFKCLDYFNKPQIVFNRPIKYILRAILTNIIKKNNDKWEVINLPTLNVIVKENINESLKFLNGTISVNIL